MSASLVAISGLTHRFPGRKTPALAGIAMEIHAGKITGLVGPDGAGKSTLLRLMAGLLLPSEGEIRACGYDTRREMAQLHPQLGYMPQRFGLYEDLTVQENLRLHADLRGLIGPERGPRLERLLEFTGLAPFTGRLAGQLSGGMKQKLGLACALICKPRLLLLDEPSVGVDPISRRDLWGLVRELVDANTAVVWSTAYLDEAEQCDETLLLSEGRLLFSGPPGALSQRVSGRIHTVQGLPEAGRRILLEQLQRQPEILDGIVQGRNLRLLSRESGPLPPLAALAGHPEARIQPAAPRFEDGFLDILGGARAGDSALAAHLAPIADDGRPVVEAERLTKRFGDFTAVREASFSIRRGEIFGLLGPNGAGKSTTFKMLCGLLQPSSGRGTVAGFDLRTAATRARSRLGYMAQKFSLYGDLSVEQNLGFFAGIYGLSGSQRRQTVAEMLRIFELEGRRQASARDLPPGFKQRLALACAVMHQPDILFLDEPTSGVDPITRREFWNHINGLVGKGVTILVTTHFMDEAEYCDRIALVYKGEKIAEGSPETLKQSCRTPEREDPTLEEAFVALIRRHDGQTAGEASR